MSAMNAVFVSAYTSLPGTVELDTDTVTPGVLGFLVIFAIAAALFFLMRSMKDRLGGMDFDASAPERGEEGEGAGTADEAGTAAGEPAAEESAAGGPAAGKPAAEGSAAERT